MNNTSDAPEIETLFRTFLNECLVQDKDIEYCLLQSTVEPTIRFKFGSWLNRSLEGRITLNLMEANRLDLVIGIDDFVYIIEFGHLLNILQHGAALNKGKVQADANKIVSKADKLIQKIRTINKGQYHSFFEDKKIKYVICSLFSDLKVVKSEDLISAKLPVDRLKSGTMFKYGKTFSPMKSQEYFDRYLTFLPKGYDPQEDNYLTGYSEVVVIPEQLSLHFRFDYL